MHTDRETWQAHMPDSSSWAWNGGLMTSLKNQARLAGWLYLLTSIVGFFAMGYVPGKLIVDGNAAATANNIVASETLYRLGIAGSLIGQAGFIFVSLALYELL